MRSEDGVLLVVHGFHGSICLGFLSIANKAKASTAASVAVLDNNLSWSEHEHGPRSRHT